MCHLFASKGRPIISVDWSDLDGRKQHDLICAVVASQGRPFTLYEEAHDIKTKEKPKTHRLFLSKLKSLLPVEAKPIIVTDAGFKRPAIAPALPYYTTYLWLCIALITDIHVGMRLFERYLHSFRVAPYLTISLKD